MVYSLLSDYSAGGQDALNAMKIKPSGSTGRFDYLDQPQFSERFIRFRTDRLVNVILYLPSIHCSACIYLLENLPKIEPAVNRVTVDFLRKEADISFDPNRISLKTLAELLTLIGYEPDLQATIHRELPVSVIDRNLYIRLGIAGFCAGNMMLFALPDYFAGGKLEPFFYTVFNYLNFILSFAVMYSAGDYFRAAFTALRERVINMDVPVALGIAVIFFRSAYEVLSGTGTGYFDSLSGLVFFLLLGKIFQKKTYHTLSFERDYKSYFPISVTRVALSPEGRTETHLGLDDIRVGDRLVLRHGEIIPADSVMMSETASVDYSFVTGESRPVTAINGDRLYAGGKITGASAEVEVIRDVSQSYLTQLWNRIQKIDISKKYLSDLSARFAGIFTWSIIVIAAGSWLVWHIINPSQSWFVASAVLIIACPCALALALPFTYGAGMRLFGRMGLYLKNANIIERLSEIDTVVFDKTGTLTRPHAESVRYHGKDMDDNVARSVRTVAGQSTHPLSRMIHGYLTGSAPMPVLDYEEIPSMGIQGKANGIHVRLGNRAWIYGNKYIHAQSESSESVSVIHVAVNDEPYGFFSVDHAYREGLPDMMSKLKSGGYQVSILSGDHDHERGYFEQLLGPGAEMLFQQSPYDKLDFIDKLRSEGRSVLMIGDGLNDAGALYAGSAGMAVTDNIGTFTPNSDAILDASALVRLPGFLTLSATYVKIVYAGYIISLIYNTVGITLAVLGYVTPLLSAILMPVSSISVVALSVGLVKWKSFRVFSKNQPHKK